MADTENTELVHNKNSEDLKRLFEKNNSAGIRTIKMKR